MKKASLSLVVVIVLSTFYLSLATLPENARGAILYVGGTGPGNYSNIQDAVDAAFPGDTISVYEGTYNENVIINKTLSLFGENRLSTIIDGGGAGDVVNLTADWTNISGFTIRNSGSVFLEDAGMDGRNIVNCNISGNIFRDNPEYAIFFWFANNTTVFGNTFQNNGAAVVLLQSYWNILDDNDVSGNPISIAYRSENNTVSNNTITSSSSGIYLEDANNNVVIDNILSNNAGGITATLSNHNKLVNNTITSSTGVGIIMGSSHNNTVAYNIITDSWTGIELASSSDNIFLGNNISLSSWEGLRVGASDGNVISNNSFSYNLRGLYLSGSRYGTLENNEMYGDGIIFSGNSLVHWNTHSIDTSNTLNGKPIYYWKNATGGTIPPGAGQVILANCSGVTVDSQNISYSYNGIQLGFSSYNSIANSNVSYNAGGIYLQFSENNTIVSNTLFLNGNGVALDSGNNRVYHNSFILNTVHAYDTDGTSQWDDGYPSGGNYWDDYTGVDLNSGPNQDIPGSDRIGDTRYQIQGPGFSEDRYPLMNPAGILGRPKNLTAKLAGPSLSDVTLEWELSSNDGSAGNYVIRYDIFRGTGIYSSTGAGYGLISSVPNGTTSFTDLGKGEGDPDNHFFVVCAVDSWNGTSCSDQQAGKFARPLSIGPNLVSFPLIQSDNSIQTVLQTVSFDNAWSFDSTNREWKSFAASKPYPGELTHLNHTIGFWLNVTSDSNLTVAGVVPLSTSIHLAEGWNLISFPSFKANYTVGDLVLETNATRIETFSQMESPYYLRALIAGDDLLAGYGYWIEVRYQVTWTIDNDR